MKAIVFFCCFLTSFQIFASSRLTFMVESASGGKQIALVDPGQKDFSLVTSGPLWHLYPRLSSDGAKIVYSEGKDGKNLAITILNLKDHFIEQWTPEIGQNLHARFSGDGKYLAFSG